MAAGTSVPVLARGQAVREARGRYRQAVGAVIPHVSYDFSYVHQGITPGASFPSYIAFPESTVSKLSLTQPLFSGFREYAGIAAARRERLQRVQEETRARQTLLADVTDAFFTLIETRQIQRILADIHAAIQERVTYLQDRVRVGRARRTEVAGAQVLLFQNEAQLEAMKAQELDARKQLEYVTGIGAIGELDDTTPLPQLAGEKAYTGRAFFRPDVIAASHALEIARRQIVVARGGFWPSVNFTGNYYLRRTGQFVGIDWDTTMVLELPLLPVVQTLGAVQEAAAKAEEARLAYDLLRRNVLIDIQTAYADAAAANAQQAAYARALAAAEENYTLEIADYRLNLVSNLEVLTAIQSLQNARQSSVHALYNAKRAYWRLRVAAGEAP